MPVEAWSVTRVVETDQSMITLLDPRDLVHHQSEPAGWFMYDFSIKDDLQTGRFSGVLTKRSGKFNVRVTFGELTQAERSSAGPRAIMRLRVINQRLLLSGGDAWPSEDVDYRRFAHDSRLISIPNGDYRVIITAIEPGATQSDYVFRLSRVASMSDVKHAPAMPQLVFGEPAAVVGVNAKGFQMQEQCLDVPGKATWTPLVNRAMPIPGLHEVIELPRSVHDWGLAQLENGGNAATPLVVSRSPEVGQFGFYLKPRNWNRAQLQGGGGAHVKTLVRCAVQITNVVATPTEFSIQVKAVPTLRDRLVPQTKRQLVDAFHAWLRNTNDPAWRFKSAMLDRSESDAALILGFLGYLDLSSRETEQLLPMSNADRADYLLERLGRL